MIAMRRAAVRVFGCKRPMYYHKGPTKPTGAGRSYTALLMETASTLRPGTEEPRSADSPTWAVSMLSRRSGCSADRFSGGFPRWVITLIKNQ